MLGWYWNAEIDVKSDSQNQSRVRWDETREAAIDRETRGRQSV